MPASNEPFNPTNEQWYVIKKRTDRRWTAYKIPESQLKNLKKGYEWMGPYTSLFQAMIRVNNSRRG